MKKTILFLAALALIAIGCNQTENLELPDTARVITLTTAMPDNSKTRITYTPDDEQYHGLILKWEENDKLMLCFEYENNFYHTNAPLVANSIREDGKWATFTITLPDEIPDDATFNFYAVYQKTNWNATDGGSFISNTSKYRLEESEEQSITLNMLGEGNSRGTIRPMLLHKEANLTVAEIDTIRLEHTGWVMAIHFLNGTNNEVDLPEFFKLQYSRGGNSDSFIWNGYHGNNTVTYDVKDGTIESSSTTWDHTASVFFDINRNTLPLYNKTVAAGDSITLYRWVMSTPGVWEMSGQLKPIMNNWMTSSNRLNGATVEPGKVYHVYMKWDGSLSFGW